MREINGCRRLGFEREIESIIEKFKRLRLRFVRLEMTNGMEEIRARVCNGRIEKLEMRNERGELRASVRDGRKKGDEARLGFAIGETRQMRHI